MATKDELRAKLRIPAGRLDAINDLLLDPDSAGRERPAGRGRQVRHAGRDQPQGRGRAAARQSAAPAGRARLRSIWTTIQWLTAQRDAGAFVSEAEYRRSVLGDQGRRDDLPGRFRGHPGDQRGAVLPLADRRSQAGHRQPGADARPLHPRAQDARVGGRLRRHAGARRGHADHGRVVRRDAGHQGHRRLERPPRRPGHHHRLLRRHRPAQRSCRSSGWTSTSTTTPPTACSRC